ALSNTASVLTAPSTVTVPPNGTAASFTIAAGTITADQTATLTATLKTSASASVLFVPPVPAPVPTALSCTAATLSSGGSTNCVLTFSRALPAALPILALSNTASVLTAPSTVTVPPNATAASFTIAAGTITADQTATLTA